MKNKDIIRKICEKTGHRELRGWSERCFCKYHLNTVAGEDKELAVLGFLKSKETLIAVFGEEEEADKDGICLHCGGKIQDWKYHAEKMSYTLEEILGYYEKYLVANPK